MEQTDITQKAEHIDYQGQDEIGIVVNTYNKMVDDLERSSRQLAESEREQAWREMARQIAHEIKNPLTPMRLSIQHLRRMQQQNIPDWDKKFSAVSTSLLEQIDILSDTAAEFSNFAKFYNEEITLVDLCALLKDQILLFNNRDNVLVSFESNAEAACVQARRSQITRVFVNLISNAIQAVEGGDQGHVHVSLIAEGGSYRIQVEDNGSGVSEENLNKLFKPNFTTKTGGTGLGLAICKNIVEQSNGSIHYQRSEKMGGANFYLLLPKYNAH
jgi:nitrogen fixation/metabolism regulation signal transduction histidine kinase